MLRKNILFVKRFCANVCLTKSLICSVCRPVVGPLDWLFLTQTWGQWGAPSAADGLWRVALRACCLVSVLWRAAAGGFRLVVVGRCYGKCLLSVRYVIPVGVGNTSPAALEHSYGAVGEVLRGSCSVAPGLLEKVYSPLRKLFTGTRELSRNTVRGVGLGLFL